MGAGNRSYVNKTSGAHVTAARIVKSNLKAALAIASVRSIGDDKNEKYAVAGPDGDIPANPGDWVVKAAPQPEKPLGDFTVIPHLAFAAAYVPAPPKMDVPNGQSDAASAVQ